jgi:transcriptional regulator with GAF, ATPase, and Fis domain
MAKRPGSPPPTAWRELATSPRIAETVSIPRLELRVEREAGRGASHTVVVDGDVCRLGSQLSNELVLADPLVSRFHCRLSRSPSGWRLADSGSLNGTRVNGVRVRDGDLPLPECRLELGDSVVTVRELGSAGAAEVPVWPSFGGLHGTSLVMRRLFGVLDKVSKSDANVLIEGESGSGKELVATEIVQRGPRADKAFVVVDCGAISPSLIESELFGHARGAFTGADRERPGAFESANGGTVFLDEIGEMPLEMQPKLLRALEAREVRRVGESQSRKVDVRVIAATNRRLEREVNHGRFREDLYFRLSVVTLHVPPLRERLEDIPMLVNVMLSALGAPDAARLFTPEVISDLSRYEWPGNVRELRNYIQRTVVLETVAPASNRRPDAHSPAAAPATVDLETPFSIAKEQAISEFERRYLTAVMTWAGGNVSKAARRVGMDRMYLHRLVGKYGLRGPG